MKPIRLRVTLDLWSSSMPWTLEPKTEAYRLFLKWRETDHDDDYDEFVNYIVDDVVEKVEMSISHVEEVPDADYV